MRTGANMIRLANLLDLPRTLKQEIQLRRQRRMARVAIKALEKRILLGLLEHQLAREGLGETLRETRLTDADRPLDDDVAEARRIVSERFSCVSLVSETVGMLRASRRLSSPRPAPLASERPRRAAGGRPAAAPALEPRTPSAARPASMCCTSVHQSASSRSTSPQRARSSRKSYAARKPLVLEQPRRAGALPRPRTAAASSASRASAH